MALKQISVFVANQTGSLEKLVNILAEAGVDMRAMSIADTTDYGILRLIVDKPDTALAVLQDSGCLVSVTPVLAVMLPDVPGGLASALSVLESNGVNIEYMYSFAGKDGHAQIGFKTSTPDLAVAILQKAGAKII